MYEYLFVQAALEVERVVVAPDEDMESCDIVQTSADSLDPVRACPKYNKLIFGSAELV
jgi:hypothetical protein